MRNGLPNPAISLSPPRHHLLCVQSLFSLHSFSRSLNTKDNQLRCPTIYRHSAYEILEQSNRETMKERNIQDVPR